MLRYKSLPASYNYALSQLFSFTFFKKVDDPFFESEVKSLIESCSIYPVDQEWNLYTALDIAYQYLKQNYRCEYVYKNEIANQLLLKYHNDNSATLLKEINSNSSIADIVIINGNTVAYEIKTELDSFDRLQTQIDSYRCLYDYVYVVTHRKVVNVLKTKINKDIGIIVLSDKGVLTTIRKAQNNVAVFESEKAALTLRQSELVIAYENTVGQLPIMGTALIHSFCFKWYLGLSQMKAHEIFATSLKSRKLSPIQFDLVKNCSPSLKMLFLGKELSKKNCHLLMGRLGIFG